MEVDAWLAARIEKLRQEAEERRTRHWVAAGRALAALRSRGESVGSIADQAGISQAKVREYLNAAGGEQAPHTLKPTKSPAPSKPRAAEPGPASSGHDPVAEVGG